MRSNITAAYRPHLSAIVLHQSQAQQTACLLLDHRPTTDPLHSTYITHTVCITSTKHHVCYLVIRIPTLLLRPRKKFQDFSRSPNVFSVLCRSPAMLNYTQTAVTYSVYTVSQYNPSQNVHHKLQRNCLVST